MNVRAHLIVGLLGTAAVAGCGKSNISWKEEVLLANAEVIVVQRTAKTKAFGEIGGPGGWENEGMTVEIVKPLFADKPPVWNFPYVPLIFDRDTESKQWFMVATFYSCESWYELGRPRLPYVEFKVENGAWKKHQLSPSLIGRRANMLTSIRSSGEPDHTIATKTVVGSDPQIAPKFQKILNKWSTGC
jgi:hypothetical protein